MKNKTKSVGKGLTRQMKFTSVYEYTEKMCRSAAVYVYYRRTFALIAHIILAAVCVVGTAFSVYYIVSGREPQYNYSTYFFYALAPIVTEIVVYLKYRDMLKKEKQLLRDGNNEITVSADSENLIETEGEELLAKSPLFDVEKVYAAKEFFLIIALSGEYYIFKRGSFTEGDEKEFVSSVRDRVKEIHKAAIERNKQKKKQKKEAF